MSEARGNSAYAAPTSFTGVDSFTYVANDGVQNSNLAKVSGLGKGGLGKGALGKGVSEKGS